MYLGELGRMNPDQEAVYRNLKRWYKAQRKAMKKSGAKRSDLRAAEVNVRARRAALKELKKRFKAGQQVNLLSPTFEEVSAQADADAQRELEAEAKSPPMNYGALALAAGAAYLLS